MSFRMLQYWSKLYTNQTPAEQALEPALASTGQPYRTQHPVWALGCFVDFALIRDRVAIEVDDPSHRTAKKRAADRERTAKLERAGWKVVRCSNEQALTDPWTAVDRLMQEAGLPYRTKRS